MARSTLARDYDIGRMLKDYGRRITVLERLILQLRIIFTPGVVYDTGWVAVPAAAGFTSSLEVRRIGRSVQTRGALTPTVNWGAANSMQTPVAAGGIPAGSRPATNLNFICPTTAGTAATIFRVVIQSNGGVSVRCDTATFVSAASISVGYFDS